MRLARRPLAALSLAAALILAAPLAACRETPPAADPEAIAPAEPQGDAPLEGAPVTDTVAADADAAEAAPETGDLVATVNGAPIALAEFQRQAFDTQRFFVEQGLDPNSEEGGRELLALRRQLLLDMINQALVEQAAVEMGIEVTDDEVRQSLDRTRDALGGDAAFEASMQAADTSEEEIFAMERSGLVGQRVFDAVTDEAPETAPFVRARHILCSDEAACQQALARLEAGEDFAAVAREVSVDALTAPLGGDLEWIPRLEGFVYLPSAELQDAILALGPGQRSDVVHTDFGYHVIEVVEEDPSREIDPERRSELRARAMQTWLAERRAASDIVIYLDDLKDVVAER